MFRAIKHRTSTSIYTKVYKYITSLHCSVEVYIHQNSSKIPHTITQKSEANKT